MVVLYIHMVVLYIHMVVIIHFQIIVITAMMAAVSQNDLIKNNMKRTKNFIWIIIIFKQDKVQMGII